MSLTKEQALQKLKQYCTYQERCHYEVRQKLYELKAPAKEHDEIIAALIEEDYLNEERFAKQYAGGKFRMKGWGKKKIMNGLREKQINDFVIKTALKEIDEDDYRSTIQEEAEKKFKLLKSEQWMVRRKKTMDYLLQKGYEYELVNGIVNSLKASA